MERLYSRRYPVYCASSEKRKDMKRGVYGCYGSVPWRVWSRNCRCIPAGIAVSVRAVLNITGMRWGRFDEDESLMPRPETRPGSAVMLKTFRQSVADAIRVTCRMLWGDAPLFRDAAGDVSLRAVAFRGSDHRVAAMLMLVFCGGCMNPNFVRYPTWTTSFPHAENMAYQQQDPFPDPDIGPSTGSSPRGYDRPRSLPRRAAEQRLFQGIPAGPESVAPGAPLGGLQRPRAIN